MVGKRERIVIKKHLKKIIPRRGTNGAEVECDNNDNKIQQQLYTFEHFNCVKLCKTKLVTIITINQSPPGNGPSYISHKTRCNHDI